MTIRHTTVQVALAAIAFALGGCYTVLIGPRLASEIDDGQALGARTQEIQGHSYRSGSHDPWSDAGTDSFGDSAEYPYDDTYDDYAYQDYGRGYPVMRASSGFGLYGFGSPFAYGPGLGSSYSQGYGGYSPAYGPYGYGYDPYYSDPYYRGGGSSYVPPGYELVTRRELANLRTENAALRGGSTAVNPIPSANQQEALRRKQADAERAWDQRAVPATRKSTSTYRAPTTRNTAPKSSTVATSKPATTSSQKSGSKEKSGSSAAKRRKKSR
jgi:hypothetical protein